MSEWHEELELALLQLEDAVIDSDCMTYVISGLLTSRGIFHQSRTGYAEDGLSGVRTTPHCWIELEDGWCIDLRLRRWLADEVDIPHGVFRSCDYPRVQYYGCPLSVPMLDHEDLSAMTNDAYGRVFLRLLAAQTEAA